jgi:para-aminobenzoate synthetase component 1
MGGIHAQDLAEIRNDLTALDEPGFWAISGSFEGSWTLARFNEIRKENFSGSGEGCEIGDWNSSFTKEEFVEYVERIRERISRGDVYQVNACRILSAPILSCGNLSRLLEKILLHNPAPFAGYLSLPNLEIVSASPERFLSRDGDYLISSPIKGTSATPDFLEKDRAENLMIVDLIRNDLGMVCETGSVSTPRLLATEEHPGLHHLVSDVRGRLRKDLKLSEVLSLLMPPGSVSGAPKSSAVSIIHENEIERGPYCGVFGWSDGSELQLSVAIRTFWRIDNEIRFGTGAGITWDSDPIMEWEETELKARKLISLTKQ